ncbi:MAG: thioredoxin domain-containing protein, partial [Verrucomicrobiota bacterium]|nr:thioredoxin domain-containing protein [Verrucomicrobiota bacterium]
MKFNYLVVFAVGSLNFFSFQDAVADETTQSPKVSNEIKKHKFTNRLINEKSPYLLQHAHNPVDWYPWGEEAFEVAKKTQKPILLSVGYSTCHWCHVMERESFEDEEIAKIMNEHFICVKLDREERPDVDKIYMTAVQALVGSGGWPLNVFLTPDLKPFFGGTYFPPKAAPGRASWPDLCLNIAKVWKEKREGVIQDANNIADKLGEFANEGKGEGGVVGAEDFKKALVQLKSEYDSAYGGWGQSPKFPRPSQPIFLLQLGTRLQDQDAIDQVTYTCRKMANGGMYDQLGGGFCRYSVDEKWLVPHFEKMLYDNAQLVNLYLDAYLVSGEKFHANVVRDILRYILRDMTHPEGGFYSAEDADSEGKEGKFYCWTKEELEKILSDKEMGVVIKHYGITRSGNFEDHSDPDPIKDQNVLSVVDEDLNFQEILLLQTAKKKMSDVRDTRVRPGLDDKILTSWNGLMLGAIARASAVLGDDSYLEAAEKNLSFLRKNMWDTENKRLYHRWRDGARDDAQI